MNFGILQTRIDSVLASIPPAQAAFSANAKGKSLVNVAYETYLLTLVLSAIRQNQWNMRVVSNGQWFVVPGHQCSIRSSPGKFSLVEFQVRRTSYQVLQAVTVATASTGAELEADVLVLRKDVAEAARLQGSSLPFPCLRLLIEAKNVRKTGRMEGKSFIGTCQQLRREGCIEAFVSSNKFSVWVRPMLNNNRRFMGRLECFERVTPLPGDVANETAFVNYLATAMSQRL